MNEKVYTEKKKIVFGALYGLFSFIFLPFYLNLVSFWNFSRDLKNILELKKFTTLFKYFHYLFNNFQ